MPSYGKLRTCLGCHCTAAPHTARTITKIARRTMGKYFLAWLLGVPGILLVLLYFFFR